MSLEQARALAEAVLLEGYALYPYRASAPKNRFRWAFGLLAPRAWSEAGGCEAWWLEAQILVAGAPARIAGQLGFFQIARRRVEDGAGRSVAALEADGRLAVGWDQGVVNRVDFEVPAGASEATFALDGAHTVAPHADGRVILERMPLTGRIGLRCEPVAADRPLARITIRVENTTPWAAVTAPREDALVGALASTHLVIGVTGGELVSAIDPPAWAAAASGACRSTRTYPVLVGPPGRNDVMLSAPFIMYDHAQLAPESAGDTCDATEIDELLMLRTRTLTDEEKRQARATDTRTAAIIDRADALPPARLVAMHGATRDLRAGEMVPRVPGLTVGRKVRLLPSTRRTDAQDLLYANHVATIRELREDVDGTVFLAVTIDDDPAAELHAWYGRHHYYRADEVELL